MFFILGNSTHKGYFFLGGLPLAFVGMLCALFMQKKELGLQRQELEETRQVLRETKEETNRFAKATEQYTEIEVFKQKMEALTATINTLQDGSNKLAVSVEAQDKEINKLEATQDVKNFQEITERDSIKSDDYNARSYCNSLRNELNRQQENLYLDFLAKNGLMDNEDKNAYKELRNKRRL